MLLHLPKFCILWGNFEILPKKEVVNRYISFAAKTKATLKKAILGKTKTLHPRYMESSKSDVLRFSKILLLKGVFDFGSICFILLRIDYFKFEIFLDIFSHIFPYKKKTNK